jgi:hypothetical protein
MGSIESHRGLNGLSGLNETVLSDDGEARKSGSAWSGLMMELLANATREIFDAVG